MDRESAAQALDRSGLIEVHDVGFEKAVQLLLLQDQEMIQAFSSHAPQKAFADGISSRRPIRRSKHLISLVVATACKMLPECAVIIPDQIFWRRAIWSCFSQLVRNPGIGRRSCHIHVNHLPRLQFDNEEGEKWTKEEIGHLQKITGPHPRHLCCMIAEKHFPVLSTGMFWANMSHILLKSVRLLTRISSLSNSPRIRLDTLGTPEPIVGCHFLDQANRLGRNPRLSDCTFDLCSQNTRKSSQCQREMRLWLDKDKRLFPGLQPSSHEAPGEAGPSFCKLVA